MLKKTKSFCSVFTVCTVLLWACVLVPQLIAVTTQPFALEYAGTHQLQGEPTSLTGAGVKIATVCRSKTYVSGQPQNDFLFNLGHVCFKDGEITFVSSIKGAKGVSAHATAIGAILAGSDEKGFRSGVGEFRYAGACPDSSIDVYEFWYFVSNYIYGGKPFDADILTMSVGEVFDSWWSRGLERLADKKGLIVVAGIGNGSDVYDSVLYPGVGPNVIGVGVIDSVMTDDAAESLSGFTLPNSRHSSMGPSFDGRCGPDIVAPGNCLVPDAQSADNYDVTGDWSSFATPVVSGTIALLVQGAKGDPEINGALNKRAGNCVVRSILLTSARKLPYWHKGAVSKDDDHEFSLDFVQGAGMLDGAAAYDLLMAGRNRPGAAAIKGWDRNEVEKIAGGANSYVIDVADHGDEYFTATLVWNRHYRDRYPYKALFKKDSDLRLELWADDPANPGAQVLVDYSDSIDDNIEHIHVKIDKGYTGFQLVVGHSGAADAETPGKVESYGISWRISSKNEELERLWYDINGDGRVNIDDAIALMNNNGKSPETSIDGLNDFIVGDINLDGVIDIHDIVKLLKNIPPEGEHTEVY